MRTLKKTLCFVLALVMVLGIGAFGVYAESTTSASTGDYTEASKVTEAIGVFIGGDGTDWSTPLTRAQAATLLCRLDGKTDEEINAMTISNTFTDLDPWAEPFVAYAEREGLILGVGGGRFDPQGALTGYQWALMLLRALGYTDAGEGINSDNWQVITARLSRQAGLDKNIEDMSAQLSREEGAQMVYNALKADMVEYNNGVTVTTNGDTSVNVSGSRKERTTSAKWGSDIDNKTDSNGKYIIQLGESLFKGDLQLADDERDDFGRPDCDTWKYKGKEIVTLAASDEHLVATHIGKVEYKDLYADLGDTVVTSLKNNWTSYIMSNAYVDGVPTYTLEESKLTRSNGDAILNTGNGSYTEVYNKYDSELRAYMVTVVVINTYLGKVSGNYNSSKGELVISTETSPGALDSYKLSSSNISGLDGFSDKDYILYTCALVQDNNTTKKWEVKNVYAPTILEDVKVSSFKLNSSGEADNVTVDGSTYKYSKWRSEDATFKTLSTSYETTGDFTYDIYLDENDFVVYAEGHSASGRYVFVESTDLKNDFGGNEKTLRAKVVNLEGVKSTVTISKVDNISAGKYVTSADIDAGKVARLDGDWFRYNVDTDGKYRLTSLSAAKSSNANATVTDDEFSKTVAKATAKNNVAGTTATDKKALYFDNATIFVVYDSNSDVYHVYNGITNLPNIKDANVAEAAVKTTNNHVSYMYISATNVTDSGNVKWAFIRSTAIVESSNTNGKTTYTYSAVMENDEGTVDVFDITLADPITQAGLYYWFNTKDGMPSGLIRVDNTNTAGGRFNYQEETSAKTITYADGTVSCNGTAWPVNSAAQSWKIKNNDGSYKGGDAEKLGLSTIVNNDYYNKFMGEIFVVYKSGNDQTITQIFFMYDGEPKESSSSSTASTDLTYVGIDGTTTTGTYYLYYYVEAGGVKAAGIEDVLALLYDAGYPYAASTDAANKKYDLSDSLKNMIVEPYQVYKVTVDGTVYYFSDGEKISSTALTYNPVAGAVIILDKDGKSVSSYKLTNSVKKATGVLVDDAYVTLATGATVNKKDVTIKTNYSKITGADLASYEAGKAVTLTPTAATTSAQQVADATNNVTKYYDLKNGTIKIAAGDFEGDIALAEAGSITYKDTKYYGIVGTTAYSDATLADGATKLTAASATKDAYVVAVKTDGTVDQAVKTTGTVVGTFTNKVLDGATLVDGYYQLVMTQSGGKGLNAFNVTTAAKITGGTSDTKATYTVATTTNGDAVLSGTDTYYIPAGETVSIVITFDTAGTGTDTLTVAVANATAEISTEGAAITNSTATTVSIDATSTSTGVITIEAGSTGDGTITITGANA